MTDTAVETPLFDLVASALDAMRRGGAMRVMDIPDDSSYSSHTFSGEVSQEISRRADLAAVPAQVGVKPLVWENVQTRYVPETYQAYGATGFYQVFTDEDSSAGTVSAEFATHEGQFGTIHARSVASVGGFTEAKAAAQADYEASILAALEPQPDPRDEVITRLVEAFIRRMTGPEIAALKKLDDDTNGPHRGEAMHWSVRQRLSDDGLICVDGGVSSTLGGGTIATWTLGLTPLGEMLRAALAAAKAVQHG